MSDTGKWSWILVNPVLILVKTSGILVSGLGYWYIQFLHCSRHLGYCLVVLDTGKSSFDTGKWSWILVNPFLLLVKTSGILVIGLGYW